MGSDSSPRLSRAVRPVAPLLGLPVGSGRRAGARRRAAAGIATVLGLVVLALFLAWEIAHATGVTYSHWGPLGKPAGDDYDEGAYVLSAQLLLKGYPLFHTVFSAQPAFFLPSLALVVRAIPDPVAAGHLYEALFGVLTLLGVFWMAWTAYRPLAAPVAAALLAVSPGFLLYAHAVESEMPMLGLCTLAVAAAQSYYLTRRRVMAALCGLLLMAGTEMKLLSVVVVVPLALLLLGGAWHGYHAGRSRPALVADAAAFTGCLVVPALLVLILFSPSEQIGQVITFHLAAGREAARSLPSDGEKGWQALRDFLGYDPGLLLVALAGAIVSIRELRRRYLVAVYAAWFLSMLPFLLTYRPLFQHQFVPLLPPLALLGAGLLEGGSRTAGRGPVGEHNPPKAGRRRWRGLFDHGMAPVPLPRVAPTVLVAGLVCIIYAGGVSLRTVTLDGHLFAPDVAPNVPAARAPLIALLDRRTQPADFVVCDDPMVALGARRLLPPGLEDPSRVRAASGYLTVAQATEATVRYRAAAVVASRPMFTRYLQPYLAWVAAHYHQTPSPAPGAQVYLR